jgi:outer membrane protein OmpA-like peptidoglycan-associated protein
MFLVPDVPHYTEPPAAYVSANVRVKPSANWDLTQTQPETQVALAPPPVVIASPTPELPPPPVCDKYSATLYFDFAASTVPGAAISLALKPLPVTCAWDVAGYTDPRGGFSYNQRLGLRRATDVQDWMVQAGYIVDAVHSYGKSHLISVLPSEYDKDRRVQITGVPQAAKPATPVKDNDGCARDARGTILQCGDAL